MTAMERVAASSNAPRAELWAAKPSANGSGGVDIGESRDAFAAFLIEHRSVERTVIERAESAAKKSGERFDRVLTKLGLMSETDLAAALSTYLNVPLVAPSDLPLEPVMAETIEPEFVRRNRIIPLGKADGTLVVGLTDPFNGEPAEALAFLTECKIDVRIFVPAEFERAFDALYAARCGDVGGAVVASGEASEFDVQRLRDMASEAPVIRLANQIITGAVESRASDIHIEPNADQVLVRYRIDGMLRTAHSLAPSLRAALTSRIKIMSKLDIAERRMPQDGRIKIAVRGVDIDFRVSTIPTVFGESVVMRILDSSRVELDFAKLGFPDGQIDSLSALLREPNGIILVTGPTGSGKTTTLYTALKTLNSSDRKVFTVEDPIEYQFAGINQVQVQSVIGLDFPHALRSILRQDPDIVMIGEIRDLETARIAIQASLTGHLVLSTLHTNSSAAAVTRLIDMGVENYLLASTIKGILAQRLVRNLCRHCSQPHEGADHWRHEFVRAVPQIEALGTPNVRQSRGCAECNQTGFAGRSTIAEILLIDADIHGLILTKASDAELERTARGRGMIGMYEMGVAKVWRGETTIEEVLRAVRMG
jgi:general secretion pathway protein E